MVDKKLKRRRKKLLLQKTNATTYCILSSIIDKITIFTSVINYERYGSITLFEQDREISWKRYNMLEEIPSGQEYLYDIIEAMKKGQLIEMTNQSHRRGVLRIYLPK